MCVIDKRRRFSLRDEIFFLIQTRRNLARIQFQFRFLLEGCTDRKIAQSDSFCKKSGHHVLNLFLGLSFSHLVPSSSCFHLSWFVILIRYVFPDKKKKKNDGSSILYSGQKLYRVCVKVWNSYWERSLIKVWWNMKWITKFSIGCTSFPFKFSSDSCSTCRAILFRSRLFP